MAHQLSTNYSNQPFVLEGDPRIRDNETIEQDAARAAILYKYTVMAQKAANRKWVPLRSVDPTLTRGSMVCGAAGTAEAGFQAVSDGAFNVTVDGVAIAITGLDFTGIEAPTRTGATGVCGAIGTNLAGFQAVTDGAFNITVDGVAIAITGLNWSGITALDEVIDPINAAAAGRFTCVYDVVSGVITFLSNKRGDTSTLTALSAPGAGTDVSGAGFLNGLTGTITLTQGTGDDGTDRNVADVINDAAAGRFFVTYDGARFAFYSGSFGTQSTVTVLSAPAAGTDISGAGYLNGLTGTGTATAGTGGDGSDIPKAIYLGDNIAAATLVAGDVTGCMMMFGAMGCILNQDMVVIENSLTVNSVVVARSETVQRCLEAYGIYLADTQALGAYQA